MDSRLSRFANLIASRLDRHLVHTRVIPGRQGKTCGLPEGLPSPVRDFLRSRGISQLYRHQEEGLRLLAEGRHLIVTTPTGSGKTLIYNAYVASGLSADPSARALYLFPTKALSQDQTKTLRELGAFSAAIYDGDTGEDERRRIRNAAVQCVVTNPDMLHIGILPHHDRWSSFFAGLRFVVVDEGHVYRGIFGSQVSHVIRRLRRVCRAHGAAPQFVLSSATMNSPGEFAFRLTGLPFSSVSESSAPAGSRLFLFLDPLDASSYTLAVQSLATTVEAGLSAIVFTRSRRATELLQMWISGRMRGVQPDGRVVDRVAALPDIEPYRAGYLAEERRRIERALFSGTLKGVIATSALELGIDIGSLDCCILFGWPGSVTSTWQRVGRVGRGKKDSVVVFIGMQDLLDLYFLRHPDEFFTRSIEDVVINPENEVIARQHLACASVELPLTDEDRGVYPSELFSIVTRPGSGFGTSKDGAVHYYLGTPPHQETSLRTAGNAWTIHDAENDALLGEIDSARVFFECHPGAIYLHQAKKYEVLTLDTVARKVAVRETRCDWYTQPNWSEAIEILSVTRQGRVGNATVKAGTVKVTVHVVFYEKRKDSDKSLLAIVQVSVPPQTLSTDAVWLELPSDVPRRFASEKMDIHGALHGIEHALIGIFPLEVSCDRWDIGGYSFPFHSQTQSPAVFVYDGYPGGVGIASRAFGKMGRLLDAAVDVIGSCRCESGCPSCIQSPKCGSGNRPLDKKGALRLLRFLIE